MKLVQKATIPFGFDVSKAQLMADLLLNPRADKSMIWFCIVSHQPLIDFLSQYEFITIQAMCPKPRTRIAGKELDFREFQFTGFKWKVRTSLRYWPTIAGVLNDMNDVPWFQSSPQEFIPTTPNMWTTNKHTRKPEFSMLLTTTKEDERDFLENTITLPRGTHAGHLAIRTRVARSIRANFML